MRNRNQAERCTKDEIQIARRARHLMALNFKPQSKLENKITEVCRQSFYTTHTTSASERNLQHHCCHDSRGSCTTKPVPILAVHTGADGKPSRYSRTDSVRHGCLAKETAVPKLQQQIIQNNSMHYSYKTSLTAHQGEKNSSCVRIFQVGIFCSVTLYSVLQSISLTSPPETQRRTGGQVLVVGKERKPLNSRSLP